MIHCITMREITFLGASSDIVTGSNYIVTDNDGYGIVVDFGMFQGDRHTDQLNYDQLTFNPVDIHSVLLTHAHLDHVGRLPMMTKYGFRGRIYMTAATKALAEVVMLDSAKIAMHDNDKPILYNKEDVYDTLERIDLVSYDEEFELGKVKVKFKDAGHILGSASISLDDGHKKLVFSGDLGNSPEEIVKPTDYFDSADHVVLESTYGDKDHPEDNPDETIQKEINAIEKTNATLLIPSFSIERTQVLLHKIDHMKRDGRVKNETKVYLDSPMAIKATDIYKAFPDLYNQEMKDHVEKDAPFDFPGLRVIERSKDSKRIKNKKEARVIIAGSGMMAGGRILNHAIDFLGNPENRLLIVGFQAEGTYGRKIIEGAKKLKIYGKQVDMRAHLTELYSMSAHAGQSNLMKWVSKLKGAKKVFLTHGEKAQRDTLAQKIKNNLDIKQVEKPMLKQSFLLE